MSEIQELDVTINGVRTRVLKGGSGPDLLYWHGAGGCGKWFPIHEKLAADFTVYAPDSPGWGNSETGEWMTEILDYVLHHDSLIRHLKIERPVLVGHSLGGMFAAEFAAIYPDRLASLILMNAAGMPFDESDAVPDFFAEANRGGPQFASLLFQNMGAAMEVFNYPPTNEDLIRYYRELTSTARLMWSKWFDDKLLYRLPRIETPTLVIWGAHERLFPLKLGERYAQAIPGAQLQVIEGCGHMTPFEDPDAVASAIVKHAGG